MATGLLEMGEQSLVSSQSPEISLGTGDREGIELTISVMNQLLKLSSLARASFLVFALAGKGIDSWHHTCLGHFPKYDF